MLDFLLKHQDKLLLLCYDIVLRVLRSVCFHCCRVYKWIEMRADCIWWQSDKNGTFLAAGLHFSCQNLFITDPRLGFGGKKPVTATHEI